MNQEIFIVLSIILLKYIKNIGISPIFNIFTVLFYCFAFRTIDVFVMTSLRLTMRSALFILFPQVSDSLMANCPAMVAVRNDP